MPTDSNNDTISISRTDSGFPPYLDFASMRSAAINYLGPITSAYWTDYNEHDPGITTLEALLYAIMDLGYRVNAPIQDLLTLGPNNATGGAAFLTPAQVLGSNPFTIVDYRKKLMDLKEVRNAWLTVPADETASPVAGSVNGLYDVYLELERGNTDFATVEEWAGYQEETTRAVDRVLQRCRNLCEDFNKPVVMDKRPFAVTADIELASGASIADVYGALMQSLYSFFSPVPNYYTLGQLAAMNVSLDQVFGGRPYDRKPSHGFILDSELPDMPGEGTQSLYLSAVYNLLLQVPGVKTVRNLRVDAPGSGGNTASGGPAGGTKAWVLKLKKHELPVLSVSESGFRWFSNGQQLSWDLGSATANLQKTLAYSGKILYEAGSAELDGGVPQGHFLNGLGSYYSIQNDYPEVYGIGQGGLPVTASTARQAQAMQFKGFLLFFDQLLADYLAQLGNAGQLLSMKPAGAMASGYDGSPGDDGDPEDMTGLGPEIDPAGTGGSGTGAPTYFAGELTTVPGLDCLLRFPPGGATGTAGATLAYPVDAHSWNKLVKEGNITCVKIARLPAYTFASSHDRDLAVAELAMFFSGMPPTPEYIVLDDGGVVFVFGGMRRDLVLLGKGSFGSQGAAAGAADALLYAGSDKSNYSSSALTEADGHTVGYSFNVGGSGETYNDYVGQLLEDPQQNTQRRKEFLLHLIDRFAESFTDYALLSAGFLSQQAIADSQVGLMEQFLGNLPSLSADRCKGFNYTKPGWDNTNISGFEERFKAYCGITDWRRHYLCPFEVIAAEKKYAVHVVLADEVLMSVPGGFSESEANDVASDLYARMRAGTHYRIVKRGDRHGIGVDLDDGGVVQLAMDWPDRALADAAVHQLKRMFRLTPKEEDVDVDQADFRAEVTDAGGRVVRTGRSIYPDEMAAMEDAGKKIHDIDKTKFWEIEPGTEHTPGNLERSREKEQHLYIDVKDIETPVKHDIPHKPDHCRFVVSDKAGLFTFSSAEQYPNSTAGRVASKEFLFLLKEAAHYKVIADGAGKYQLIVVMGEKVLGREVSLFDTEEAASRKMEEVVFFLRERLYILRIVRVPVDWKFSFLLGLPGKHTYLFRSVSSYASKEKAFQAAQEFYQADTGWELRKQKQTLLLEKSGGGKRSDVCALEVQEGGPAPGVVESELQQLVVAKSVVLALEQGNREALGGWVQPEGRSNEGGYIYQLVDKDRPRAFHIVTGGSRADAEAERTALIKKGWKGYAFTEFCLGGDNIHYREAGSGTGAYHFLIRCRNDYFTPLGLPEKEWVLFESLAGYATEDLAQAAFQESYIGILEKAMDRVNYGEKDFIAWDESGRRKAVVYIPTETREALERAGLNVAETLVKAARSYPIRKEGKEYVFRLEAASGGEPDWKSGGRFANAQDAHVAFEYLRLLLASASNYFIDYDEKTCQYRIGIREALAESIGSFASEAEAWGPDGVERFIGVAQSEGGLYPERRSDCSWGYFAACPNGKAIHPCSYETEARRDDVMERLHASAQGFPVAGWVKYLDKRVELPDAKKGDSIAVIPQGSVAGTDMGNPGEVVLNQVLDMLDAVWAGLFYEDAEGLYVKSGDGSTLVRPSTPAVTRDKWERMLLSYGAYFPIVRKKRTGVAPQYKVEIKLPGFAAMPGQPYTDKACGCPPESGEGPACYAAWIDPTEYPSAETAWAAYRAVLMLLDDKANYRATHDEAALSYRIQLLEEGQLIAVSVQQYLYPEMAARALRRAKYCLNAEGVNLVEHLLLRKGKGSVNGIPVCAPVDSQGLSFNPGADPYSFIMTAFLPAWPQRFRTTENRQQLESILQREAPAHILLRILWLTPWNMCRMESAYRRWLDWLRDGKACHDFKPDDLIELLFGLPFGCPAVGGCGEDGATAVTGDAADDWLSQINLLYCWKDSACADTFGWTTGSTAVAPAGSSTFQLSGKPLKRPPVKPVLREQEKPQEKVEEKPAPVKETVWKESDDTVANDFRRLLRWCANAMEKFGAVLVSRTTYARLGSTFKKWVRGLKKYRDTRFKRRKK
jgi:hypothetical protein